ncbi:beige protein-like 1 [Mucor velutinosus]|uniref:Beige protein-like 1 n=1 Tax=Mucor velutinosus TaxID=708070 RepID=A0AAN7HWS3_9FUNG|nr:beige protein-like 1 [Mucor velutinosus]
MAKNNKHTSEKQKIPAKKDANIKKATHKRRVKGTSEVDNPKYANMDFMLSLVESAAKKEDEKVNKKLAKKALVAKIIEEKDAKKDQKAEEKKAKLEKVKQAYLEAQKKKKTEARKLKAKAKMEAARAKLQPAVPEKKKKSVRFA